MSHQSNVNQQIIQLDQATKDLLASTIKTQHRYGLSQLSALVQIKEGLLKLISEVVSATTKLPASVILESYNTLENETWGKLLGDSDAK